MKLFQIFLRQNTNQIKCVSKRIAGAKDLPRTSRHIRYARTLFETPPRVDLAPLWTRFAMASSWRPVFQPWPPRCPTTCRFCRAGPGYRDHAVNGGLTATASAASSTWQERPKRLGHRSLLGLKNDKALPAPFSGESPAQSKKFPTHFMTNRAKWAAYVALRFVPTMTDYG